MKRGEEPVDLPPPPENILDADAEYAMESFLTALAAVGASDNTISSYRSAIRDFLSFTGVRRLREVTPKLVLDWINNRLRYGFEHERRGDRDYRVSRRRRQVTMHYYTIFLRRFLEWAGLGKNLVPVVRKPRSSNVETLSRDEILKLISAARDVKDLAIVSLLFETGLRASELLSLRVGDINIITGEAIVRSGKYGKERTVFLGPLSKRIVERLIAGRKPNEKLIGLSYNGLYKRIKSLAKRAGIPPGKVRPHILRHSFATEALRSGMSLPALQRILGHTDIKTTQIYLHLVKEDLRREYSVFASQLAGYTAEVERRRLEEPPTHTVAAKYCYNCGAQLPPGAKFCPSCGARVVLTSPSALEAV